mmetsp:Transcript_33172/g.98762  ORF Transcript_33172/g.98762 Transcript_33172/m.98762 type:complete len:249 (-) Transcript_33172:106-852(-)
MLGRACARQESFTGGRIRSRRRLRGEGRSAARSERVCVRRGCGCERRATRWWRGQCGATFGVTGAAGQLNSGHCGAGPCTQRGRSFGTRARSAVARTGLFAGAVGPRQSEAGDFRAARAAAGTRAGGQAGARLPKPRPTAGRRGCRGHRPPRGCGRGHLCEAGAGYPGHGPAALGIHGELYPEQPGRSQAPDEGGAACRADVPDLRAGCRCRGGHLSAALQPWFLPTVFRGLPAEALGRPRSARGAFQ